MTQLLLDLELVLSPVVERVAVVVVLNEGSIVVTDRRSIVVGLDSAVETKLQMLMNA